ncbi:MAG: Uma2 family endonuclease [Nitrospirota bacterium]|nr:Uma2 family endonuclease [Nitrospirota bacterium]
MIGLKQKLDYSDLAAAPDDGYRYEILEGDLLVTPAPSPLHQRVSKRLQRQLEAYFEARSLGEVFNAPVDLILTFHDVVEPDLVVVAEPKQISGRGIEGAPLLVVEILSPSTRVRDRTMKARRYAELGIPYYWIVDPDEKRLECFRLHATTYELLLQGDSPAKLTHPDFPDLQLDLSAIWS